VILGEGEGLYNKMKKIMKKKHIAAVRMNKNNILFEFPTKKKRIEFIKELKKLIKKHPKYSINYSINIT
jgi:hypothetical protein